MSVIALPIEGAGLQVIASVSGGKDSSALILALREAGIKARFAFADTVWEAQETYDHLNYLRERLDITIDVVGVDGGMMARVRHYASFPSRTQRWCTRELKIEPLRAYHDRVIEEAGVETVNAIGVRADESLARSTMPEWEDEPEVSGSWGGYTWRPLIRWTVADVIEIHKRHDVRLHPDYLNGIDRVGCDPCIYENKEGIRRRAELRPARMDFLEDREAEITALRHARNIEEPGRYEEESAAYFQTARKGFSGIRRVIDWARTDRGGRQYPIFAPAPKGGCMRWGLCETAKESDK